ncbi:MAG: hypothetical protein LBJ82_00960 [Deltaproteobacteria bacterium]|jgi:hypothetical protein|nr:hypothetical protein [Deltaproteobacteria bacterium]
MSKRFLPAAGNGGSAFFFPALCGLVLGCLALSACGGAGRGSGPATAPGAAAAPYSGQARDLAGGLSIEVPNGWNTVHVLDPGAVSKADLQTRLKTSQAVPLLVLDHPTGQGENIDGRFILLITDSAKNFPPEKEVAASTAEELDQRAKAFMRQRNAAAVQQKKQPDTLESRMTKETVDGRMALFHRGIGNGADGQVHYQIWHIYLPDGLGLAVDAVGSASNPGVEKLLESMVRSIRIADAPR